MDKNENSENGEKEGGRSKGGYGNVGWKDCEDGGEGEGVMASWWRMRGWRKRRIGRRLRSQGGEEEVKEKEMGSSDGGRVKVVKEDMVVGFAPVGDLWGNHDKSGLLLELLG